MYARTLRAPSQETCQGFLQKVAQNSNHVHDIGMIASEVDQLAQSALIKTRILWTWRDKVSHNYGQDSMGEVSSLPPRSLIS